MQSQILNLATINVITDPYRAVILETIGKSKHVSFKKLLDATELSNAGLTKHLEKLQEHSLIRGTLSDPENGSYSFYNLTTLGQTFRNLLHDFLTKSTDIQPEPISNKFVIDFESFETILAKKELPYIKRLFKECVIVFTNHDFAELTKFIACNGDDELESYINDEDRVMVSDTYQDVERAVKREYYLKRVKKLSHVESRLVTTAMDLNASVISNNKKILLATRRSGLMCCKVDALMKLDSNERLTDKFYEHSLQMPDTKNADFLLQNNNSLVFKRKINSIIKHNSTTYAKLDGFIPERIVADSSKNVVEEIIIRLNGIRDPKYGSKIAYSVFRNIGNIYARKYQKDIQESLAVLDPILEFVDNIFIELYNQQIKMKKSVQNSFMMAYAEANHLEYLSEREGIDMQKTLQFLSKIQNMPTNSIPDLLFQTTNILKKYGYDQNKSMTFHDSLYALVTAKKKIEFELDWTLCSLDKATLHSLRKNMYSQEVVSEQ